MTPVLVTATVAQVAPGTSQTCSVALSRQPSGTPLVAPSTVSTSPAPSSGVTSLTAQFALQGGISAGSALAMVTCSGSSGMVAFRLNPLVALTLSPTRVPAGGVLSVQVLGAIGQLAQSAPCSLTVTAPAGAVPPLSQQSLLLPTGTPNPSASVSLAIPRIVQPGSANASLSCVLPGSGAAGDSVDFTIAPTSSVTILGITNPVAPGTSLAITAATVPGFSCTALLTPVAGVQLGSQSVIADQAGTAALSIPIPSMTLAGTASLSVSCGDPADPGNSASSSSLAVAIQAPGGVTLQSVPVAVSPGGSLSFTALTRPALVCTAQLTSAGQVVTSLSATADANGVASLSLSLPTSLSLGVASLTVSCVNPVNAAISLTSIPQQVTIGQTALPTVPPAPVVVLSLTNPVAAGETLQLSAVTTPDLVCVAQLAPSAGPSLSSPPARSNSSGALSLALVLPATMAAGSVTFAVRCSDPANPARAAILAPQPLQILPAASLTIAAALVTPLSLTPGALITIRVGAPAGVDCSVVSLTLAGGTSQPILEQSATGTVPAAGSLLLTFHLPTTSSGGTDTAIVSCSGGGVQASVPVTLSLGRASGFGVCSGAAAAAGPAPVAMIALPSVTQAGEPLQLDGAGSHASAGAALTACQWSFGDGAVASGLTPTHVYAQPGQYSVTLTVSDSSGLSTSASARVQVGGFLPLCSQPALTGRVGLAGCITGLTCTASSLPSACLPPCLTVAASGLPSSSCPQPTTTVRIATGGPYSGRVFQPLSFAGSSATSGTRRVCAADATLGTAGPICNLVPAADLPQPVAYNWNFGDGATADGSSAGHSYTEPGTYQVRLTVTFDSGATAAAVTTATIAPAALAAQQASLPSGCTRLTSTFPAGFDPAQVAARVRGASISAIWLSSSSAMLGWFPDGGVPQLPFQLQPGDTFWLCLHGAGVLIQGGP